MSIKFCVRLENCTTVTSEMLKHVHYRERKPLSGIAVSEKAREMVEDDKRSIRHQTFYITESIRKVSVAGRKDKLQTIAE
ncbi:hypothetical protein TNCV_4794121 [Trichonephila clavipes]|nr:hypothetical protein TNCV_4794121 [Trichonephila clavipes]